MTMRYFLSYSRSDEGIALRLANDLIAAGVGVWVDQYDIRPSQHWDRAVEAAVHDCIGMIVVLSPRSAASPNVADEISVAIDRRKRLIPVVIEPCTVPLRMTRMQFIDATTDYPRALNKCLAEIARQDDTPMLARGTIDNPAPSSLGMGSSMSPLRDLAPGNQWPPAAAPLDPAAVEAARRRLTAMMGPIAAVLVKTAAARARTLAELYGALADKLSTPAERKAFLADMAKVPLVATAVEATALANTAEKGVNSVSTASTAVTNGAGATEPLAAPLRDVSKITAALARSLGPIASRLVERERHRAASTDDLCQRLAALVPNDRERAVFLREVERV